MPAEFIFPRFVAVFDSYRLFFSKAGDFRNFELTIEDKSLFVNAHCLAQMSPFFAALCFNDFKEKNEQKAIIGDEKFEDILTLMSCIHQSDRPFQPVNVDNFVVLARLADKYQIKLLLQLCDAFIKDDKLPFNNTNTSEPQLLAILRAVVDFGVGEDNSAMVKLLKRAAKISVAKLMEHEAHAWLPSRASAALFLAAKENELAEAAALAVPGHVLSDSNSNSSKCGVCGNYALRTCIHCKIYVCCTKCEKAQCHFAPKPVVTKSTTTVYLSPIHEINEAMLKLTLC